MELSDQIRDFIKREDIQESLKKNDFERIYRILSYKFPGTGYIFIKEFTQLLINADINPLSYLTSIPDDCFHSVNIDSINIPEHIKVIGEFAFSGSPLKNILIPNSVTLIKDYAFYNCKNLREVIIEDGGEKLKILYKVFEDCKNLKYLQLPRSLEPIEPTLFLYCPLEQIDYGGSMEQWKNTVHGLYNNTGVETKIKCNDGILIYDFGWKEIRS